MRRRALALLCVLAAAGPLPFAGPAAPVAATPQEMEALRARVQLATSGGFYLVLERDAGRLRLFHGGAILEDYPFEAMEVGAPRRVYRRAPLPQGWAGRAWTGGTLDPAREPAVVPPEGVDLEAWVPPTPEEAYPVPPRYAVRFDGMTLEVETGAERSAVAAASRRLAEAARLLLGAAPDPLRVRLRLAPEAAASLFRGLPEGTRLLILPSTAAVTGPE